MARKGFTVDLNKPLVHQVGDLGETYQEWVHTPILTEKSPRFFKSDFMEGKHLSLSHPWLPSQAPYGWFASRDSTFRSCSSYRNGSALLGGGLVGYVIYDTTHFYLHHGHPNNHSLKSLKKYHMNHHFRIQNKGFGITTKLWDRVFETLPKTKAADKSG
ncbi:hypothetical protein V6N13_133719 [Hibiscus sabdariffa]